MICLPPRVTPPPQHSSRHGPQHTQHTASTAATPRYPQGRRQYPCRRAGPTQTVYARPFQLRQPHVHATAMKLGVDAAPAMTGFDFREGRSVPRFEGCIVCLEVAPMLIEAAAGVGLSTILPLLILYGVWHIHERSDGGRILRILRNSCATAVQWCGQCGLGGGQYKMIGSCL